jgi:WD40 repeat protein
MASGGDSTWSNMHSTCSDRYSTCVVAGVGRSVVVFHVDDMGKVLTKRYFEITVTCVKFSPCGRFVLAGLENGNLEMRSLTDKGFRTVFEGNRSPIQKVLFGKHVCVSGSFDGTLTTWDSETGAHTRSTQLGSCIHGLVFLPGEQEMLAGTYEGHLAVIQVNGTAQPRRLQSREHRIMISAIARVGDSVVIGIADSGGYSPARVQLRKLKDLDRVVWTQTLSRYWVKNICASPTGNEIALAIHSSHVQILDSATGRILEMDEDSNGAAQTVIFSPDGTRLIVGSENDRIESRELFPEAKKQLKTVLESIKWDAVKCTAGYERDVVRRYLSRLFVFYEK